MGAMWDQVSTCCTASGPMFRSRSLPAAALSYRFARCCWTVVTCSSCKCKCSSANYRTNTDEQGPLSVHRFTTAAQLSWLRLQEVQARSRQRCAMSWSPSPAACRPAAAGLLPLLSLLLCAALRSDPLPLSPLLLFPAAPAAAPPRLLWQPADTMFWCQ